MSQGWKKNVAQPVVEPRVSNLPFEHSNLWDIEPHGQPVILILLNSITQFHCWTCKLLWDGYSFLIVGKRKIEKVKHWIRPLCHIKWKLWMIITWEFKELAMHSLKCAHFGKHKCLHAMSADVIYLTQVVRDEKYRLAYSVHSDVSCRWFNIMITRLCNILQRDNFQLIYFLFLFSFCLKLRL